MTGRVFSEQLYRIREVHLEVESILQSLTALLDPNPCASCDTVCCKETFCRESIASDFLRFLLGPRVGEYDVNSGWYVAGSGCRLGYGRPLVCYEYFCGKFEIEEGNPARQLSRALRAVYAHVLAGQPILVIEDISRISASRLDAILAGLVDIRERANAALRRALCECLGLLSTDGQADDSGQQGPA